MDSDQGKLFVGGISWETTEEKLKDYFQAYGEVVESVIMKDRATGRARGFGFVAFADPAVTDRVLQEKHTIDGRVVEAKKAVPREEQQNFARSNSGGQMSAGLSRTKKIFVGGLASTVTEEDFRNYFAQFGDITDVVVMYDHNTQRPRGFGFITFDSEDAVEKVVQKPFHELHDKMVEVKKAIPKELSAGSGGRSGASGFAPGSGAGRGAPYNSGYAQGYNSSPSNAYGATRYAPPPAGRGGFLSYGPAAYGAPGYGPSSGYGVAMNGGYGASGYGGGTGYAAAGGYGGGYGSAGTVSGYGGGAGYGTAGAPSAGYVSAPVGPRSPWGNAGTGFGGGGSPAAYGAGAAPGMSGYGTAGWPSGGAGGQATGGTAAYGSGGYGYATGDTGYGTNVGGYQTRGAAGGPVNYSDAYAATQAYGDSTWRSNASPVPTSGAATGGGYGMPASGVGMGTVAGGMGAGSAADATGYGVAGRQVQRGPDARFRPYPAAGVAAQS